MRASVIIPHFNDAARLETCLAALTPQAARLGVEIIVADNGSTEDLGGLHVAFPGVRFVHAATPGAAAARNLAVTRSRGAFLFFTDADCRPAADWLEVALEVARPGTVIGGAVALFDETPPPRSGAEAFETVFGFPQEMYIRRHHFSVTANMLVPREVFARVGPFDGTRAEDLDWGRRAHALGIALRFEPRLKVAHPTRADWPALRRKWRRMTSEGFFAHGTDARGRLTWGLRSLLLLASIPAHLPRVLRHGALTRCEKLAAAAVLVRLRGLRCIWTLRQALTGAPPVTHAAARAVPDAAIGRDESIHLSPGGNSECPRQEFTARRL